MIKSCFLCAVLALPAGLSAQALDVSPATTGLPQAPSPLTASYAAPALVQLAQTTAPVTPTSQTSSSSSSNPAPGGPQTPAAQTPDDGKTQAQRELEAEEKQRMLGIMPAFNLVISGKAAPLRPGQKFALWIHSSLDPFQFGIAAIDAGEEQADNTFPEWHQGVEGFAKRYAASYGDNVDGNFWGNAVLPVLLHQDPRYYRLGHGSPGTRIFYAFGTAFRCKSDSGKWQPNYSNIAGNLIGGAISNIYYPASDRGVGLTFERGITVTLEGTLGALAEEFYPDYTKWREHVKERKAAARQAAASQTPSAPAPHD